MDAGANKTHKQVVESAECRSQLICASCCPTAGFYFATQGGRRSWGDRWVAVIRLDQGGAVCLATSPCAEQHGLQDMSLRFAVGFREWHLKGAVPPEKLRTINVADLEVGSVGKPFKEFVNGAPEDTLKALARRCTEACRSLGDAEPQHPFFDRPISPVPHTGRSRPDPQGPAERWICLDFEATCEATNQLRNQEIVEFPMVELRANSGEVVRTFHEFVKPVRNPELSPYTKNLFNLAQETVDRADTFPKVWDRAKSWLRAGGPTEGVVFITFGDWDLKCMPPQQIRCSNCQPPRGHGRSGRTPNILPAASKEEE